MESHTLLGALPVKLPFSFGNHEERSLHVKIKSLLIGIDMIGQVRQSFH